MNGSRPIPERHRLPDTRDGITHKFRVEDATIYFTVGLYEDGTPGELFITGAKEGSTLSGFMDSFAIAVSMGLQYGVPLKEMIRKFKHVNFEPSGLTGGKEIQQASSIVDYIFRWLEIRFLKEEVEDE